MIAGGWMGGVGTEAKSPRWAIGNNTHSVSKLQVVLLLSCEPTLEQTKILGQWRWRQSLLKAILALPLPKSGHSLNHPKLHQAKCVFCKLRKSILVDHTIWWPASVVRGYFLCPLFAGFCVFMLRLIFHPLLSCWETRQGLICRSIKCCRSNEISSPRFPVDRSPILFGFHRGEDSSLLSSPLSPINRQISVLSEIEKVKQTQCMSFQFEK